MRNLTCFVCLMCVRVSAAPKAVQLPAVLHRPSVSFLAYDFSYIGMMELPDALDLSQRKMVYSLNSDGTATLEAGVNQFGGSEFKREGTFDSRQFARLGALLKARGYDKFKDIYPDTPKAAIVYDDRTRTALYFNPTNLREDQPFKYNIFDYMSSAPLAVWELQAAVRGVVQQVHWNGLPLPPVKPKSGVRGILSGELISRHREQGYLLSAVIVVRSVKDKHEVMRTTSAKTGDFVLGLAPARYLVEIDFSSAIFPLGRKITRSVEVKTDTFTWLDARFGRYDPNQPVD